MKNLLPRRQTMFSFIVGWAMLIFLFILTATQFNLAEIAALGLNVPFADRLATTAQDLVGGLPLIATIFGFGFLIAMPVTGVIAGWVKILPHVAHGLGGFVGVGRHDVAIPVNQFKYDQCKIVLPGATKDAIKALPEFKYERQQKPAKA